MQKAHVALVLTETKPKEIRSCIWGGQVTADLLANTEDLRYSFKESSLACPFCGGVLGGTREATSEKKKPWETSVEDLHHIEENPKCPCLSIREIPNGTMIEKLLSAHMITQCAVAEGRGDSLHTDPSIPKLHASWEGETLEMIQDLADSGADEDGLFNESLGKKTKETVISAGQVQRAFPHTPPTDKGEGWETSIQALPRWSKTHPDDPSAPQISGWVVSGPPEAPKTLCGYILPDEEPGDLPDNYPIPIFEIHGPETLTGKNPEAIPAYAEASLQCGPPSEPEEWREAATVKRLKAEEKNRRKKKIENEIAKLPKEKIWEGFREVLESDQAPDPQGMEPPQLLAGYKSGGDIKKWWLPGIGNPYAKIWIIGIYPSNEEIKRKAGPKILAGASGIELFRLIREAGLDPATDVFLENLVKRHLPPKSKLSAEIKMEQTWLLQRQLAHFKPDRVICLGAEAFKEVAGRKSFQGFRATWIDAQYPRTKAPEWLWTGRIAGTFHPAGVLRPENRHNLELFRHDLKELLLDAEKEDVHPKFSEIRTIDECHEWLEKEVTMLKERDVDCVYSVDTESLSLNVDSDNILCIQVARIFGTYNPKSKWFEPNDVPKQVDVFILRENQEPEIFDAEVFASSEDQMSLFDIPQENDAEVKQEGARHYAVANSEEERKKIIETHGKKRKNRSLEIFSPYRRKIFLGSHEKELGEIFNTLSLQKHCIGYAFTNANHDRIRLERFLGWDLSLTGQRNGLSFPLDTMLAEHVLDENGDLGLKPCLNKHFNWPRQDIVLSNYAEAHRFDSIKDQVEHPDRRSAWSLYPWKVLRPYAVKDAYGCAALLEKQLNDITGQVVRYQSDRIESNNPNTLESAFHIQCGAINGTYEMNKMGMPLGDEGLRIMRELTEFYRYHETNMVKEYKDSVFRLTGLRDANPASPEELGFVLFNENSPLRKQGIEPWKESGRNGRLWSEIPPEERGNATPSTDAESLEIIASNCPDPEIQRFLMRLSETKTILTIRSSFLADEGSGKGLDGRINYRTKCMHTYYTPTLDTNRCRSVPNLSTFPKDEVDMVQKILGEAPPYKIREIVQAPPGTFLLNRDWTTAEVLGLGYLSQDPNMLQIISRMNLGMDFHCKLAIKTYSKIQELINRIIGSATLDENWLKSNLTEKQTKGATELWKLAWQRHDGWDKIANIYELAAPTRAICLRDEKPFFPEEALHTIAKKLFKGERSNIKPVTFGVPYGREAPAIMKQLNRDYYVNDTRDAAGNLVTVTLEESQTMIDSYKTEFSTGWGYLEEQAELAISKGYLRDHWGYIRHFPSGMNQGEITRKAYNYQIQHIVAVLMNQAMDDWVQERARRELKSYSYATLYDNIGWVVYEDELQEVWDLSMEVMTAKRPAGPKVSELPILAEWAIPTSGELSLAWEGEDIKPESLGIAPHPELNLTGLEGKF